MTPEELDERIAALPWCEEYGVEGAAVEELIRDCIEAVTPMMPVSRNLSMPKSEPEIYNKAVIKTIMTIEQNTKDLLG